MSSPEETRKIVLSPRARKDFIDILRFTGETWVILGFDPYFPSGNRVVTTTIGFFTEVKTMEDNIKPLIDQARQCHPIHVGQWLQWVRMKFDQPCDAATLAELKALQAELEKRKRDAEPPSFLGASAVVLL
mgnify:CR=1 FL=1